MCEFCTDKNKIKSKDTEVNINNKKMYVSVYNPSGYSTHYYGSIEINYCPMCGKKLGDDE